MLRIIGLQCDYPLEVSRRAFVVPDLAIYSRHPHMCVTVLLIQLQGLLERLASAVEIKRQVPEPS